MVGEAKTGSSTPFSLSSWAVCASNSCIIIIASTVDDPRHRARPATIGTMASSIGAPVSMDDVRSVREALARGMGRRLVEVGLGGDGDDLQSAPSWRRAPYRCLRRLRAAMPEDDNAVAGIERLVIQELFGIAFGSLQPEQLAHAAGAREYCAT